MIVITFRIFLVCTSVLHSESCRLTPRRRRPSAPHCNLGPAANVPSWTAMRVRTFNLLNILVLGLLGVCGLMADEVPSGIQIQRAMGPEHIHIRPSRMLFKRPVRVMLFVYCPEPIPQIIRLTILPAPRTLPSGSAVNPASRVPS